MLEIAFLMASGRIAMDSEEVVAAMMGSSTGRIHVVGVYIFIRQHYLMTECVETAEA